MLYFGSIGLLLLALVVQAKTSVLPSYSKTCKRGMPNYSECLQDAANRLMPSLASGMRSFKIPQMDPLAIDKVRMGATGGTVSLQQTYTNSALLGFTKGFIGSNFDLDFDKLIMRFETWNPQIDFVGNYAIRGSILFMPINGQGRSNVTLIGLRTKQTIHCDTYEEEGRTYLKVKKYEFRFNPENVLLKFDNLFDEKSTVGSTMKNVLNRNTNLIFDELRPSFEKTFSQVFAQIVDRVFTIPMDTLFPQ